MIKIFFKIETLPEPARTAAGLALIITMIILTAIIETL